MPSPSIPLIMRASAMGVSVRVCAVPRRAQQQRQLPRSEIVDISREAILSMRHRHRSTIVAATASSSQAKTKTAASSAKRSSKGSATPSSSPDFGAVKHVLRDADGSMVQVGVCRCRSSSSSSSHDDDVFKVSIEVELLKQTDPVPTLAWGTYRAATGVWRAPRPLPAGATADPATGGARTEFVAIVSSGDKKAVVASLELPARSAPVSLAFFLDRGEEGAESPPPPSPLRRHLSVPIGMGVGSAARLGASLAHPSPATLASSTTAAGTSVNFCVTSRHAASMSLVLVRLKPKDGQEESAATTEKVAPGASAPVWRAATALEIALDPGMHRSGDAWHVRVDGLTDLSTLAWGWRAGGELVSDAGSRFSPGQVMLDPYARAAAWARLPEGVNVAPPRPGAGELDALEEPPALLGCLGSLVPSSEEEEEGEEEEGGEEEHGLEEDNRRRRRRRRGRRDDDDRTAVLEVDPRSPSSLAFSPHVVPEEHRGKLFGIIDAIDASPPALFGAGGGGITAVLLRSPVTVALPGPLGGGGGGAPPFAPVSLLAPDPSLAVDGCRDLMAASRELREFVAALHARGIDAYASLEVCFTGESEKVSSGGGGSVSGGGGGGGEATTAASSLTGRALSLRGLDAATYYKPGTRVLDSGAPATRALAVEAARHLSLAFGFDGVQLANAEATAADSAGAVLDAPPLPEALAHDPVLRNRVRLFASAADEKLLPRSGVRGFPHWAVWGERNWRCARDVSRLMLEGGGDSPVSSAVATRAAGSPDLTSPAWGARCGEGGLIPGNLAAGRPRASVLNVVVAPDFSGSLESAVSRAVPPGAAFPVERDALAKALLVAGAMFRGTPLFPEAAALLSPTGDGGVFVGARFLESLLAVRSQHAAALAPREDGGAVGLGDVEEEEKGERDNVATSLDGDSGEESEMSGSFASASSSSSSVAAVTSTPRPDSPPPRPTRSYDSSWDSDDGGSSSFPKRKKKASISAPIPAIRWHGAHAAAQPDWDGARSRWGEWGASVIAWSIVHNENNNGGRAAAAAAAASPSPSPSQNSNSHASSGIYVALNPCNGPVALTLPPPPSGSGGWSRAIDTSLAAPDDAAPAASILGEEGALPLLMLGSSDYELGARSALVLIAEPKKIRGGVRR